MSELTHEQKTLICGALTGFALADHLGDVRDYEENLWEVLGVTREELRSVQADAYDDNGGALEACRVLGRAHGLPFPDYIWSDDD